VRHAAVRAVSGGTSSELPAVSPSMFAQTKHGVGKQGVYATLDANAAMASLTTIEKMMLIRQVPMFSELSADDLEELAQIVEECRYDAGQNIFAEGEAGDAVYLIVKGAVVVVMGSGPSERIIERTRTLRVPGEGFKRVMSERPEMSQAIVAELVKRMRKMMSQGPTPMLSSASIPIPK
jgi:hypothetical protein